MASLARSGKTRASHRPMDMMIASHDFSLDANLVTHNTCEYARVKGLRLENWVG